MARVTFVLLIALIGQHSAAAEENLQKYLDLLKSGTLCEKRSAVLSLHGQGKQAVRILLEHIDDTEIAPSSTLVFQNPVLSYVPPGSQHDQFAGMLYAYVIELILAKNTLSQDGGKNCDFHFLLGPNDYVYGHGLIFKGNEELIDATDLPRIKQIYLRWWDKNQDKSLAQMRQEWKASHRPLAGSQYKWG
jgi:hypothetical protein